MNLKKFWLPRNQRSHQNYNALQNHQELDINSFSLALTRTILGDSPMRQTYSLLEVLILCHLLRFEQHGIQILCVFKCMQCWMHFFVEKNICTQAFISYQIDPEYFIQVWSDVFMCVCVSNSFNVIFKDYMQSNDATYVHIFQNYSLNMAPNQFSKYNHYFFSICAFWSSIEKNKQNQTPKYFQFD